MEPPSATAEPKVMTGSTRHQFPHSGNSLISHARCRERLFSLINELPTCYEVVSGKAAAAAPANKGKKRAAASGAGAPRKQYKQVRAQSVVPTPRAKSRVGLPRLPASRSSNLLHV